MDWCLLFDARLLPESDARRVDDDRGEDALLPELERLELEARDFAADALGALTFPFLSVRANTFTGSGCSWVCSRVGLESGVASFVVTLSKARMAEPVTRTITRNAVFSRGLLSAL